MQRYLDKIANEIVASSLAERTITAKHTRNTRLFAVKDGEEMIGVVKVSMTEPREGWSIIIVGASPRTKNKAGKVDYVRRPELGDYSAFYSEMRRIQSFGRGSRVNISPYPQSKTGEEILELVRVIEYDLRDSFPVHSIIRSLEQITRDLRELHDFLVSLKDFEAGDRFLRLILSGQ